MNTKTIQLSLDTLKNMFAVSEETIEEMFVLIKDENSLYEFFRAIMAITYGIPEESAMNDMKEALQ